jgi:hypothetical protein
LFALAFINEKREKSKLKMSLIPFFLKLVKYSIVFSSCPKFLCE